MDLNGSCRKAPCVLGIAETLKASGGKDGKEWHVFSHYSGKPPMTTGGSCFWDFDALGVWKAYAKKVRKQLEINLPKSPKVILVSYSDPAVS